MNDGEKIATYNVFIEDMLHVFQERFSELDSERNKLSEFNQGKWLAYWEVLDIIKTRKDFISDMLSDEKDG